MRRYSEALPAGSAMHDRRRLAPVAVAAAFVLLALTLAPGGPLSPDRASAEVRAKVGTIPDTGGADAGDLNRPRTVAVNQTGAGGVDAGDVYVFDDNNRVSQFSATGTFVRAFGLDVVASGEHETGTGPEVCEAVSAPIDVCQVGVESSDAGSLPSGFGFASLAGIAIDQSTGNVYVYNKDNLRVSVFSAKGKFQGAFGWKVKAGGEAADALQFCTTTGTGCQAGEATSLAGGFGAASSFGPNGPAVDSAGKVYVPDPGNRRLNVYTPTLNGSDEVVDITFDRAIGWNVNATTPAEELQVCTTATGCQQGTAGNGAGQFGPNTPTSVTVDAAGNIYAVSDSSGAACSVTNPCRIQKFDPVAAVLTSSFGPATGECATTRTGASPPASAFTTGPSGRGVVALSIDPGTGHVFTLQRTFGSEFKACELDPDSGEVISVSPVTPLVLGGGEPAGIAVGTPLEPGEDSRIYAANLGPVQILAPVPPPGVEILPVSEVNPTTAKLNGKVTAPPPGGFETIYHFELSGDGGATWTNVPMPDVSVGTTPGTFAVQQLAEELQPSTIYRARLTATTGPSATSAEVLFKTGAAPPTVLDFPVSKVTPTSVRLSGSINPNNSPTNYRFEYGETTAYGNNVPADFEPFIGSGGQFQPIVGDVSGLKPNTTYHWRIVATSPDGKSTSPDHQFTTYLEPEGLNDIGLPYDRRFELVSPADKRPTGEATSFASTQHNWQAAENGEAFSFQLLNAKEDSTAGGETVYVGSRSAGGWQSAQVSSPSLISSPIPGLAAARPSVLRYLSPKDLKCGVLESFNPLTGEEPEIDAEFGIINLYRWSAADGSYTLLTNRAPINPNVPSPDPVNIRYYEVAGMSDDCSRVFFRSAAYRFLPNSNGIYEWDNGTLRNGAVLPDESLATGLQGSPQGSAVPQSTNPVSPDGRLFFAATSNSTEDAGKQAVFVRKSQTEVVNASKPTDGPTQGASYEAASPDGSRVFFLANYGIASTSSAGPTDGSCGGIPYTEGISDRACDLYAYDIEDEELTDLSATSDPDNPKGAVVQGVMAVSDDGSSVYFAARGQLVAGKGRSYAQNLEGGGSANIYRWHDGALSYVGILSAADINRFDDATMIRKGLSVTAQTNEAGTYLLYQSVNNLTGNNPAGLVQVHQFSTTTESSECLSCPASGDTTKPGLLNININQGRGATFNRRHSLGDDGRVIFTSEAVLAPGAIEGHGGFTNNGFRSMKTENNLYEAFQGKTRLLLTGQFTSIDIGGPNARDVFIQSYDRLSPHDFDFTVDVYDIRAGGGFAPPAPPPVPCDPAADQCQGDPSPQPQVSGAASSTFTGPGNVKEAARRCNRNQVRRGKRCVAKRALARRACAKRKGKAKRRCVRRQMKRLNRLQRRQNRAANRNLGGNR